VQETNFRSSLLWSLAEQCHCSATRHMHKANGRPDSTLAMDKTIHQTRRHTSQFVQSQGRMPKHIYTSLKRCPLHATYQCKGCNVIDNGNCGYCGSSVSTQSPYLDFQGSKLNTLHLFALTHTLTLKLEQGQTVRGMRVCFSSFINLGSCRQLTP